MPNNVAINQSNKLFRWSHSFVHFRRSTLLAITSQVLSARKGSVRSSQLHVLSREVFRYDVLWSVRLVSTLYHELIDRWWLRVVLYLCHWTMSCCITNAVLLRVLCYCFFGFIASLSRRLSSCRIRLHVIIITACQRMRKERLLRNIFPTNELWIRNAARPANRWRKMHGGCFWNQNEVFFAQFF